MRPAALLFALALASSLSAARPTAQRPQSESLPPLSWTCPMHPDILEDKKGICSICKMDLVPVRLDSVWSCPVHAVIAESKPGKCPIDRRDLIQLTVAVSWTCPGSTTECDRAGHVPERLADGQKSHAARARQSQPAARRPVLHGVRQLASSRRHIPAVRCVPDASVRRLHQAAAGERGSRHHGERRHEGCGRERKRRFRSSGADSIFRPASGSCRCPRRCTPR